MSPLKKRWNFVSSASRSGWDWLVEVSNHASAVALVLLVLGVSILSAVKLPHWWYGLLILLVFYMVIFAEGSFRIWAEAHGELSELESQIESSNTAQAVAIRLEDLAREYKVVLTEIPEQVPDDREQNYQLRQRISSDAIDISTRVAAELRRSSPDHLAYWRTNPPDFPEGQLSVEDWTALVQFSIEQIETICSELRK